PTWRFSHLIGQTFIQILTMLLFILVTFLEFHFLFGVNFQVNALSLLFIFICAIPSIYGIGFTFASLVIRLKEANSFVFLVRGIIMIFCGITYPISILPGWMAKVSVWIPQTYLIRTAREATLNNATLVQIGDDLWKMVGFGVFWLILGFITFNWMERQARKSGSIGQY
ncbi:MAG TPA: ABC transporter permease, partial [Anaerolineaceae bacterium]|nr:ABC transporter permease [Anaerolineaceae bacterium]